MDIKPPSNFTPPVQIPNAPKGFVSKVKAELPEKEEYKPKTSTLKKHHDKTDNEELMVTELKQQVAKARRGGARPNSGRPKGAISTKQLGDARRRLSELRFDPMEKMVRLFDDLVLKIKLEELKSKPSTMLLTSYRNTAQKCLADLLKYGYVPPAPEEDDKNKKITSFLSIVLTDNADSYRDKMKIVEDSIDNDNSGNVIDLEVN